MAVESIPTCCCSKCGVPLSDNAKLCCLCVCDKLCVSLSNIEGTGTGDVYEVEIPWSTVSCAYVGEITCGTLTVDLKIEPRMCDGATPSNETCFLCLTSVCLGLDQVCGDGVASDTGTGTGSVQACNNFEPGQSGECGTYLRDCSQLGGWDQTWSVDASECNGTASPDENCQFLSVHAECYPRINPAGSGTDRVCKNCDCVCECVRIDYEETGICGPLAKLICYGPITDTGTGTNTGTSPDTNLTGESGWQYGFDCADDNSPLTPPGYGEPQEITITLQRNEDTGCCEWKITLLRGTFVLPGSPDDGTSETTVETECPDLSLSFSLELPATGTGSAVMGLLDVECAPCAAPVGNCCGYDLPGSGGLNELPIILNVTLTPTNCAGMSGPATIPVYFDPINQYWESDGTVDIVWGGDYPGTVTPNVKVSCTTDSWSILINSFGPCTDGNVGADIVVVTDDCELPQSKLSDNLGGIGCCGYATGTNSITVTLDF